jgi:nucleoid-associated protein YgaU
VRSTRPADSLWSIAQARLGDGNRWEEIADLNNSRTMTDGTIFHANAPIQPGWALLLPADATPAHTASASTAMGTRTDAGHSAPSDDTQDTADYTVKPGDNLSQKARAEVVRPKRFVVARSVPIHRAVGVRHGPAATGGTGGRCCTFAWL